MGFETTTGQLREYRTDVTVAWTVVVIVEVAVTIAVCVVHRT